MRKTYEELRRTVKDLQDKGILPIWPTDEQRADWAYGNAVIENRNVTREMAEKAVHRKTASARG